MLLLKQLRVHVATAMAFLVDRVTDVAVAAAESIVDVAVDTKVVASVAVSAEVTVHVGVAEAGVAAWLCNVKNKVLRCVWCCLLLLCL